MARFTFTLPNINYPNGFDYPALKNRLADYPNPEQYARWGSLSAVQAGTIPLHGFVDDWRIEAIWRDKFKGLQKVAAVGLAVAPDFTVEHDDPLPHAFYQVWRSRVVAAYWQECGVFAIPALQWSRSSINRHLFKGLHDCEVVAVRSPTRGSVDEWIKEAEHFLKFNSPKRVLHFGTKAGIDIWGGCAVNLNLRG